ncbi:hypothetical protein IMCC14465_12770 [alpha proteobacterium IMCC14465]|uniref:Uncharacterized protein n=1 Tax=alpha proteobacterium IMCC14465 TaxID=1220535 RepID=J9DHU9_9PROT|nr:hypothetical protein IMCC14465_12770 [alpha proteobacterium IMCC14465]
MSADLQLTRTIHMTVQTAEKRLLGYKADAELNLSCTLVNIARGNCAVSIYPIADFATPSGSLEIEVRRPVMNLAFNLQQASFDKLCDALAQHQPRPVDLIILLDNPLQVTIDGDLSIQEKETHNVRDLSWRIPLC